MGLALRLSDGGAELLGHSICACSQTRPRPQNAAEESCEDSGKEERCLVLATGSRQQKGHGRHRENSAPHIETLDHHRLDLAPPHVFRPRMQSRRPRDQNRSPFLTSQAARSIPCIGATAPVTAAAIPGAAWRTTAVETLVDTLSMNGFRLLSAEHGRRARYAAVGKPLHGLATRGYAAVREAEDLLQERPESAAAAL
jgi:hypothetical protein